jgi:hypothetical protein
MNYTEIIQKTEFIIKNLNSLDTNISKIKKKINTINRVYQKLLKNKILVNSPDNTYLLFQTQILQNEHRYYKTNYDIILKKYAAEICELSEYICMVLFSLHKLEIDNVQAKNLIISRMIQYQKPQRINYGKLTEMINNTIHNLKLIDEFVKLFDKYVNNTLKYNNKANIHNNNFENTIVNKKKTILMEYHKYCDKFIKLIEYFRECSTSIMQQINTSDFLKFFLTEKTI